ncbi:hypothetical protein GALL_456940 [mine drainage metagenome]|uniref:Uncharacterized protein n=1 Tax=mine drainage metagenome TaxID=410659 RepID=A0A1J5Q9L8_9ZZZZ
MKIFISQQSYEIDPLLFAINQGLVDFKTWEPKASGVLLFSDNPSGLIPKQCAIKIARYQTREDDPERDHLEFTETIEGCLYHQINKSVERIKEILSKISIWTAAGLGTVTYPQEAVWELLVNAVIHRDYSISDNILVSIYNDRVEIKSPGKLPGFVTVENIKDARFSRNKNIVRLINKYVPPPNRDMGEGVNTACQKMKDWQLKDPEFREDGNYFIALLPHTPLAEPDQLVLEFVRTNGTITNRQARELTGIRSENSVKNVFYRLRDSNKIERVPGLEGNKATWRLKL